MTDVDGIMSIDPNKVKNPKIIDNIDTLEISELSYFGAKVIHPKTIQPIVNTNIIIKVKNTFNRDCKGTIISNKLDLESINRSKSIIRAVTSINNMSLITIKDYEMSGKVGVAASIFDIVAQENISIPFITQASSETTICFAIPTEQSIGLLNLIKKKLNKKYNISNIKKQDNVSLITIIGINMINTPGISGKIFSILGEKNINIKAISQGSSEISISIVIDSEFELLTLNTLNKIT